MKNHFYVLAYPADEGLSAVRKLKARLTGLSPKLTGLNAPGHLSVCSFRLQAGEEVNLILELELFVGNTSAFFLQTEGPGYFPDRSTVFLSFSDPTPFNEFQQALIGNLKNSLPALKRNMSVASMAHLTIARGVQVDLAPEVIREVNTLFSPERYLFNRIGLMMEQEGRMRELKSWMLRQG